MTLSQRLALHKDRFWNWFLARNGMVQMPDWRQGEWAIYKGTLGHGIYWHGREVWSLCYGDFLCSRWWETPEEALENLQSAKEEIAANGLLELVDGPCSTQVQIASWMPDVELKSCVDEQAKNGASRGKE